MQITTYHVSHKAGIQDVEAKALLHLINDTGFGNGDNRSYNALRAQIDALFDADMQHLLGIRIEAEQSEASED